MPWIELEDGTPVHVTMAKRGAKLTGEDIKALREIAEAARRQHATGIEMIRVIVYVMSDLDFHPRVKGVFSSIEKAQQWYGPISSGVRDGPPSGFSLQAMTLDDPHSDGAYTRYEADTEGKQL